MPLCDITIITFKEATVAHSFTNDRGLGIYIILIK